MAGVIKVGSWGGNKGAHWDMGPASRITRVQIYAGLIVDSIKVQYVVDGTSNETRRHGGSGGKPHQFQLREREYIKCISGHVKDFGGTRCVSQLTFVTNLRKTHGPFGQGGGVAFSVPVAEGRIIGFFGNAEKYLNALGIYLKPN
uniref:Jacalin-type lectin domain-containing protein n=1 Tax=Musa acuminata subsp. malaccensis TaxID=214687 RepID=A0A804JMI7_MUSAM|nr:PREDICTED: protein GOS9-like [Musa acuminata subsp. malaccensis]